MVTHVRAWVANLVRVIDMVVSVSLSGCMSGVGFSRKFLPPPVLLDWAAGAPGPKPF
jgi:hypothetical protein